jgi:hypothetical protein
MRIPGSSWERIERRRDGGLACGFAALRFWQGSSWERIERQRLQGVQRAVALPHHAATGKELKAHPPTAAPARIMKEAATGKELKGERARSPPPTPCPRAATGKELKGTSDNARE